MYPDEYHQGLGQRRRQRQRFLETGCWKHDKIRRVAHTVDCDAHQVAHFLDLAAGKFEWPEIPENEVVICTAGLEFVAVFDKPGTECTSVSDNLLGILLKRGVGNLLQCDSDSCDRLKHCV